MTRTSTVLYAFLGRRTPKHRWARAVDVRCTCGHTSAIHDHPRPPGADCRWSGCGCPAYTPTKRWWSR